MNAFTWILILTYVPLVLLARWINYKRAYAEKVLFFRTDLERGFWFIPGFNLVFAFTEFIRLIYFKAEHGNNKFLHWLFITNLYIRKEENEDLKDMLESDKIFRERNLSMQMEEDAKNYNSNDDFLNYKVQ